MYHAATIARNNTAHLDKNGALQRHTTNMYMHT